MRALLLSLLLIAQPAFAAATVKAHITTSQRMVNLTLETATTPAQREHGLMNRKKLKPHDGMAFFFREPAEQRFWMKDTLIPLDILFVDEAGSIVYIVTAKPLSLEPVGPNGPVATVIELDGGRAAKDGIAVGDKVVYDGIAHPGNLAH